MTCYIPSMILCLFSPYCVSYFHFETVFLEERKNSLRRITCAVGNFSLQSFYMQMST